MSDSTPTPGHRTLYALTLVGISLVALGGSVILGWLLEVPELVRIVPGFAAMVFNTALSFVLMGTALMLADVAPTWRTRLQVLLGGLTATIATLVLSQDLFAIDIGIDHLFSADWLKDERQFHTRMAPNTALAFILSGTTLILLNLGRGRWTSYAAKYLALIVGLIGLTGLSGYVFKLEFLFAWYPYARMAVHTATGFTLLSIGLWACWRRVGYKAEQAESPDTRIIIAGGAILVAMALTAGIAGFLLLVQQTEVTLKRGLQVSLHNRVEVYRDNLNNAVVNVRDIAQRPAIQRELQRWQATPGHPEALDFLRRAISSYTRLGMSAVALDDANGRRVTDAGNFVRAPTLRVPLNLPHRAELIWKNGLVLRTRVPVIVEKQVIGSITAEQPLPLLTQMFENVRGLGETGEMVLCAGRGDQVDCFPTRLRPEAFTVPRRMRGKLLPIAVALDGFQDVSQMTDYRGKQVIAAYSPVHQTGLGMVIKMNVEELYQPLHHQFQLILLLLLALTVVGMLLLRWQVLPLARRLVAAEGEARERESRFRSLLEAAPDAVVVADTNGRIVLVNSQVESLFGYARAELIGQPVEVLQPEHLREQHVAHRRLYATDPRRRAMGSGQTLLGRRKDGTEFPVEVSLSPLQTEQGLVVISAIRDVSERRRMQQELSDKELFLRSVIDNLPVALFCKDVQSGYRFTLWNNRSQEMFGLNREQVLGKSDYDLFPKEQADFFRQKDQEVMQHGRTVDIPEEPIDSKSLGRILLHTRKVPVPDIAGKPHYLLGISEDITERVQAQAERTRLLTILEQAPDFIGVADMHGNLKYHNRSALRMVGLPEDTDITKLKIQDMHPEWAARKVLEEGIPAVLKQGVWQSDNALLHRDGHEIPVSQVLMVHRDHGGHPVFLSTIMRDITERKQAEQTIRELSLVDELTGLRNRRGLMTLAESEFLLARRMRRELVLFYIDLDGMKAINDAHGHTEGDNALRDAAGILRKTFRDSDILARLGGDEFVVLALETENQKPEQIIHRLEAGVAEFNSVSGRCYTLSLSIGAVHIEPGTVTSLEELLKRADAEMYRVKQARGAMRQR